MTAPNGDPRMPAAADCVLPLLLEKLVGSRPDDTFAVFDSGESWSYARTLQEARSVASALQDLAVRPADRVLIWLPNGPLALKAWFGTNWRGAVSVAINTAYRGALLQHVVTNCDAGVAICHGELVDRLLEIEDLGALRVVITSAEGVERSAAAFAGRGVTLLPFAVFDTPAKTEAPGLPALAPWDLQSICYTSGTTGPSKGVLSSYLHLHTMGWHCTDGVTAADRYLIQLPLFHVGGTLFVTGALARGASIAVMANFSTPTFLRDATRLGATHCLLLGAMAGFLMRAPPDAADRQHSFRRIMVIPLAEKAAALAARFGVEIVTLFNMSEISAPIVSEVNPEATGSCGRLRRGIEARLVDEHDCEVPDGTAGELVVRADCPWTLSHGYHKMPEATAAAWRNGWFHTGDLFRRDRDGQYYFVDRGKDAIRRRGENISSFEVEEQVLAHEAVQEAAVVGVASDVSEQEVMAIVVLRPGRELDPAELVAFLTPRLPHFMVPRYIRIVAALPKTPTSKIEKHRLRADGITPDAWDREAAGIRLKRTRL